MSKYRAVLVLVVVAVLGAGCGGGGGDTQTAPIPPAPEVTTATIPGTDPALVGKARSATLQPSDFPPGYEPQSEEPGQGLSIDLVWSELTSCLGVERMAPPAGVATSPTFKQGLATQGRSTVEYVGEPAAAAIATALAGPKALDCLTKVFVADVDRSKPEGATPGPVKVTPREGPTGGQRSMAWRINASVNLAELVVPLFQDFVVIFDRGTVIRLLFLNPGSEFPQTLERSLVDKVVVRASATP